MKNKTNSLKQLILDYLKQKGKVVIKGQVFRVVWSYKCPECLKENKRKVSRNICKEHKTVFGKWFANYYLRFVLGTKENFEKWVKEQEEKLKDSK